MAFTAEQRAKGLAVRMANKAARDAAKSNGSNQASVEAVGNANGRAVHSDPPGHVPSLVPETMRSGFDWERAPLQKAMDRLADFKREYEAAAQVVLRRQQSCPAMWTCWTKTHKDLAPRMTKGQCRGSIPDGKWVFKDDGVFEDRDGIRVQAPVVCCSQLCYTAYVSNKPINSLSRH